ncbi:SDR family oxidoreductase [Nonomuraea aurantiaca]|uniref:SDR family oxidoreductase n=1 Tax=Nonomuraea aurantiaca TaxID=2878562 RepID=UPI001CD9D3AE|nr:SDR family oxidoreductase [Nonomuraea aurantiaca]MCA2229585.1 SDR family oxidoreductase [Nonomuraea aurantiaca]
MILVTGATGSIGTHLVGLLRERDVPLRALVRDEAKGHTLDCDYVVGDFDDPGSLPAAMEGVDQLLLNAGGAVPVEGEQPMVRQQKAAIDAACAAGVSRVVKVSVWPVHQGGRLAVGAHWEIEEHLRASGLGWTMLRPSAFMQNFLSGAGAYTADGELVDPYSGAPVSYVDCYDIAACAAALLTGPGGLGEAYVLTGPRALTHAEIARELSAALGRTVGHVELSPEEVASALRAQGLPKRFADDVAELSRQVADGALATPTTAVRDLIGREPRTFGEFLAANAQALRAERIATA